MIKGFIQSKVNLVNIAGLLILIAQYFADTKVIDPIYAALAIIVITTALQAWVNAGTIIQTGIDKPWMVYAANFGAGALIIGQWLSGYTGFFSIDPAKLASVLFILNIILRTFFTQQSTLNDRVKGSGL